MNLSGFGYYFLTLFVFLFYSNLEKKSTFKVKYNTKQIIMI